MYICVKSLFFRLKDEERIRGGLYFVQGIPRDENWKASENIIFFKKKHLMLQNHVGEGMHFKFPIFLGIEAPAEELPAGRRCGGRGRGSGEFFFNF